MKKHIKIKRLWRTYRGLILLGLGFAILLLLSGCTTNTAANDYCLLYRPIYADYEKDTTETIQQIDFNNIVFDTICDK